MTHLGAASDAERLEAIVNAPAKEAIFDIQVEGAPSLALTSLENLARQVQDRYPTRTQLWERSVTIVPGQTPVEAPPPAPRGFRCQSADGTQVVQFRFDGFTFSRLPPYTRWEKLYPEVQALWAHYCAAAKPQSVKRVATRFINVLEVPGPSLELSHYLTAPPEVPRELPQNVDEFLYRVVFRFPEERVTAIVTQASHLSTKPDTAALLLDLDIFSLVSFPPTDPRLDETFEVLHELKNRVFLRYLKREADRLFK